MPTILLAETPPSGYASLKRTIKAAAVGGLRSCTKNAFMQASTPTPTFATAMWAILCSTPVFTLACFVASIALLLSQPVSEDASAGVATPLSVTAPADAASSPSSEAIANTVLPAEGPAESRLR
jgi:hypothetical protein